MPAIKIPAIEFRQKRIRLYLFSMQADKLERLVESRARVSGDREGIQRLLDKKRLLDIAEYVSRLDTAIPNNIIVNLTEQVRFESSGSNGMGVLVFPEEEGHFGDILDGQHRLYGIVHKESKVKNLELAITAIQVENPTVAGRIFADINSKQKPVSKVLLVSLQQELGAMLGEEDLAAAFVERLDEESDSPLFERIQMFQDQKNKWLTNVQAMNIMRDLLQPSKTLRHMNQDNAVSMLKAYLTAVSVTFPKAWGNNKEFRLTTSAGLEVIFALFDRAREIARENVVGVGLPNHSHFQIAIEPIKDTLWDAETFKNMGYTSSGGRTRLRNELLIKLPPPGTNNP